MAEDLLDPNGDVLANWTRDPANTTNFSAVDEGYGSPDDNDFVTISTEGTIDEYDLESTAVVDADTVTAVAVRIRARVAGAGTNAIDITLNIGGTNATTRQALTNGAGFAGFIVTNATWDADWTAAQLNAATVEIQSIQSGMPESATWDVSVVDVRVTYTPAPTGLPEGLRSIDSLYQALIPEPVVLRLQDITNLLAGVLQPLPEGTRPVLPVQFLPVSRVQPLDVVNLLTTLLVPPTPALPQGIRSILGQFFLPTVPGIERQGQTPAQSSLNAGILGGGPFPVGQQAYINIRGGG